MEEHWTVGRVAELAGVSVRTLHHYDGIGLVRPSARTAAGYRAYAAGDVERLREVLAYRRLGFGLREIEERVRRAMSVWTRVGPEAEGRAVRHLGDDLASGRWAERNGGLARLDAADLGLRLLRT